MQINKALLALALGQAYLAAEQEKAPPADGSEPKQDMLGLLPEPTRPLKGTPPNPARMTKAQQKAAKRERRKKAAT